ARGSRSFHTPAARERRMNDLPCADGNRADQDAEMPPDPLLASHRSAPSRLITRRELLIGIGGLLAATKAGKWLWTDSERFRRTQVLIARADSYNADLVDIIRRGLSELRFGRELVRGKAVLLKPNLVEPTVDAPHVNTHPAL